MAAQRSPVTGKIEFSKINDMRTIIIPFDCIFCTEYEDVIFMFIFVSFGHGPNMQSFTVKTIFKNTSIELGTNK